MTAAPPPRQRLDKWLWHARFFKTRSLAARRVGAGQVRVNGIRSSKPAQPVGPGDVLTFAQVRRVRVIRIVALADRRGPAAEAQALYDDLEPESGAAQAQPTARRGARPEKRDRRALDRLRSHEPE